MGGGLKEGTMSQAEQNGHAIGPAVSPLPPFGDGVAPKSSEGRDAATGRFAKGWKGGPGNPFGRQVAAYRRAFLEAVGEDGIRQIAAKLHALALAGDVDAAKVVLSYTVGKPDAAASPDRVDLAEWQLLREAPDESQVLAARKRLDPGFAFAIARSASLLPALALLMSAQLSGPKTAPLVRAALEAAGYGDVLTELDAMRRRIAENERQMDEHLGAEAQGSFEARARLAHAKREALNDG
jgi:hypothetical protein